MSTQWTPPPLDARFVNGRDRKYYQGLIDAYSQVAAMVDLGVVADDLHRAIQERITRVAALIEADGATSRLGGRRNRRIRPYIGELTDLLVDLVDAAVEHQAAALHNDSVVSVALEELRARHAARAAGHDEVAEW
ncbi:MAG: hypothetical protein QNJ88_11090 [Acidimicrobiia bacterium]|nr:hypothetical protein [Acidimicrobiia bacterium]